MKSDVRNTVPTGRRGSSIEATVTDTIAACANRIFRQAAPAHAGSPCADRPQYYSISLLIYWLRLLNCFNPRL